MGHVVHFGASGARNVITLFFMLGCCRYGFDKKRAGIRYTELVFINPVESVGHVVDSGASRLCNVDTVFFISGGPSAVSIKSTSVNVMPNLCFFIW
jgi:hypothetical protein